MSKQQLIDAIAKQMAGSGWPANIAHLKTRTVAQLRETYQRTVSINSVTASEMKKHCDVSFIR